MLDRTEALEDHALELEDLCRDLAEPNVFYEPWFFLPLLRQEQPEGAVRFLLVFEGSSQERRLCGFFPLLRDRLHPALPLSRLRLWRGGFCFRTTPLVRAGCVDLASGALIRWLDDAGDRARVVELPSLTAEGPVQAALDRQCAQSVRLRQAIAPSTSAMLVRETTFERYLERRGFSPKTRKTLSYKARKLGREGRLQFERAGAGSDVERLIEDFLSLEASGWKGRNGTALASQPQIRAFFREMMLTAHRRERLNFCSLRLDDRMIAARIDLLAPPGGFCFKLAYDEAFSPFSPGVLLALDDIRDMHERSAGPIAGVQWIDSCVTARGSALAAEWPGRRSINNTRLAIGRGAAAQAVVWWPRLRTSYRRVRTHLGRRPSA